MGRAARGGGAALVVHGVLITSLVYLLSFRDAETPRLVETPVEVVTEAPKPPETTAAGSKSPGASKSADTEKLQQALAPPVAPDPRPPAPAQVQPPPAPAPVRPPTPSQVQPPPPPAAPGKAAEPSRAEGAPDAPKLVAPPPEPARAATDQHQTKPANAAPVDEKEDAAQHEAKPAEVPSVLATADPKAGFAVPLPAPQPPKPIDKPAPPVPEKEPSATQKLAAVLPMGAMAMPASFRSALAGNGAQANAAYRGVVFGQFNRHPEIGERARQRHLRGQVIIAFTIDDGGAIAEIGVAQTSGDPGLDALGIELIRASAPFPPPPPDAQRSFTPALAFGE